MLLILLSVDEILLPRYTNRFINFRVLPFSEEMAPSEYADNLSLLTDTSAQAVYLLHILEQAARNISLFVNSDKTVHVS